MTLTPVEDETEVVLTVKDALFAPKGTMTLLGALAAVVPTPVTLLVLRSTTSPPTVVT